MATGSKLISIARRLSTKCIGGSSRATNTSSRTASCRIRPTTRFFAGYRDFIRLVLRRTGKTRYLSKNNNNLLRLHSLAKAFPDSVILIPVRDPRDHALSLLNQHKRFLDSDAFTRDYMGWLGHYEFGATHRPLAWDGAVAAGDPQSLDYWLSQWIAAHQRIEALDRVHKNIQLVPYHALMSDPASGLPWRAVSESRPRRSRKSASAPTRNRTLKSQRARSSTRRPNCTGGSSRAPANH